MAKIIFLGTSASIPTKFRDNTSFIFSYKKTHFLIDCPGSICQKLLKININFAKIKNLIITHSHPDHIYGVISLIHSQAYLNDQIKIYASSGTIKIVKKLISLFSLNKKQYPQIKYINVFKKNPFIVCNQFQIKAVRNKHTRCSFAIKFYLPHKTILYTSDTAFYPPLYKEKLDYLISDCTASSFYFNKHPSLYRMHTSSRSLKELLLKNPCIKKLIPLHFLLLDKNEEKRIKQELFPLGGRVIFVNDEDKISL